MEEIKFFRTPQPDDLDLREQIRDRYLQEPSQLISGFPSLRQVFRDRVVPADYYEATFGPSEISLALTTKRGGVSGMKCTGGAGVVESGSLVGVSSDLGSEEVPASFLCSQSGGVITYTPHT